MSMEIGPPQPSRPATASTPPARTSASSAATLAAGKPSAPVDRLDVGVPESAPAEVLDAVGVAADRAAELAAANRELHFEREPDTGRVVVQVRGLSTGEVLRTIPPSRALDVLSGADAPPPAPA